MHDSQPAEYGLVARSTQELDEGLCLFHDPPPVAQRIPVSLSGDRPGFPPRDIEVNCMTTIDIHYPHNRSMEEARAAVERVAERMSEKFGIRHSWQGNNLEFNGSGAKGGIALEKSAVHVTIVLGFLLSVFKGSIESEVHRYLEREFG
jgi:putative polyhydroxyalkanoate system protein